MARLVSLMLVSIVILIWFFFGWCESAQFTLKANLSNITNPKVDKYIFGINPTGKVLNITANYTIARWGGETNSRYNWKLNSHNSCKDWYFLDEKNSPSWQQHGDSCINSGLDLLTQIPAMGWVAKSNTKLYSFSQKKYGQQQKNECSNQPPNTTWCQQDAGNGIWLNGSYVVGNNFSDANQPTYPSDASDWTKAIMQRFNKSATIFEIDNEPSLWHSTHHDVHPVGCTYNELVDKLYQYGPVIKTACNNKCELLGPTVGWCGIWTSGYDRQHSSCYNGTDRVSHGGITMIEYYLLAAKNWSITNTGNRLLDYFDVHWYPAGKNVKFSCAEDAQSAHNRLQAPRTLYDWNYVDGSWITMPVALLPRIYGWISDIYPNTKISITEFNFGGDTCITSAMAHSEVLAIYCKYGVSLSTRWEQPVTGSIVEDSYNLFLNYDGNGANLLDTYTVDIMTNDIVSVTGYGFVNNNNDVLYVIMFNKTPDSIDVIVDLENNKNTKFTTNGVIELYGIDKLVQLHYVGTIPIDNKPTNESFIVNMPTWTVRMAIIKSETVN